MNELQRSNFQQSGDRDASTEPAPTARDLVLLFWRRLWIIALIMAVSTVTAVILSKRTPKVWRATAQVLLVQRAPMIAASSQAVTSAPMVESIDTQVTLLQSRQIANQAADKVGISAETLQNAAAITSRKEGDNVIDLAVEADSRRHAIDWTNALCQTFVDYKKTVSQDNSKETLKTLLIQAAQAKKQADAADSHLQVFEQTHQLNGIGVLDAQAQKAAALNAVLAQDNVVLGLQNESATAQAKAASLAASLQSINHSIKNSTGIRDDNAVVKLQESLQELQRQRADTVAHGYKPKFPGKLSVMDAEIADTTRRLHQAIQGTLDHNPSLQAQSELADAAAHAQADAYSAKVKLGAAIRQRDQLRRQTSDLPRISMEASNLADTAAQAHNLYNATSAAVQAAQLDKDVASGNVQIVQWGYAPIDPFRPNHKRDLLVGVGVGLCLSLLAVFLLEQSDRSVRTVADVRRLAEGPVVAVMPQMTRDERRRFAKGDTPPHVVEIYNAARANLGLAMRQRTGLGLDSHQVILVTSAIPGEGKSLTATELAQSFARAGRRVVLVNADMRRTSSAPLLRPDKTPWPSLADVLADTASITDALSELAPTEIPNLLVLHAGKATRNPVDLLSQPRMSETIQALREVADVVIVDSPPAGVVADALILAPYADCVLYVVGVGMVDSETVRHTAASLASASPKMLAYFANRIPHVIGERAGYSYASYGRTSFTMHEDERPRDYQATRTMVLERFTIPEQEAVGEAASPRSDDAAFADALPPAGSVQKTDRTRASLRILPETGSRLTTLEGPYLGQSFALSTDKPLTLGSLPDNDIVLARDATISHDHARIAPEDGGHVVYDGGSTNGTLVNDVPVSRHSLKVGDVLQLGASKFRYEE